MSLILIAWYCYKLIYIKNNNLAKNQESFCLCKTTCTIPQQSKKSQLFVPFVKKTSITFYRHQSFDLNTM